MNRFRQALGSLLLISAACLPVMAAEAANFHDTEEIISELQRPVTILDSNSEYNLNPHTADSSRDILILTNIYEGLFSYNPINSSPLYALCCDYKVSRDKLKWTFTIRTDAKFSDGSPITASTVRQSWMKLLETQDAPFASLLDMVAGAKEFRTGQGKAEDVRIFIRDNNTLLVYLNEPTAHLPSILCHSAFSVISEKENVYSGPFTFSKNDQGIILTKNTEYWDKENVILPQVQLIHNEDLEENTYRYNNGQIDWVMDGVLVDKIINRDSIQYDAVYGTTYLFFKQTNKPLNNPKFRQALLLSIPYQELRSGYSIPASRLVPDFLAYNSVFGIEEQDEFDAMELMEQVREEENLKASEKIIVQFGMYESSLMENWYQILKKAWEPLGVVLSKQVTPPFMYFSSIPTWDADMMYYSWNGDFNDPVAFLELFRSDSTLNTIGYSNAEFDRLLHQASVADFNERQKLLLKAEQILLDDSIIIPIYHNVNLEIINKEKIGGWVSNPLNIHPLKYIYIKQNDDNTIPNIALLNQPE